MTNNDEMNFDILSEFGLTENQAKVFIATTRLGNPTVSEVAEESNVRREEVYRLLPELEKMGLIERLLGKPLRLKTPDPQSAITTLVNLEKEKAQDRIASLSHKSKAFIQSLGHTVVEHSSEAAFESEFSLIYEKESVRVKIFEMISQSTQQLDIMFTRTDLIWFISTQGEALQEASNRGVKIRLLCEPPLGRDRLPKIIKRRFQDDDKIRMKYLLNPTTFYLVVDKLQLMFITSGAHHLPSGSCLWTNNKGLVTLSCSNFEEHWHASVHWKTIDGISLSVSPQEGAEGGSSHVHRILLYNSSDTKYKVLFNFLKNHFEAGNMVIYVCEEDCIENVKDAMYKFGFDMKLINAQKQIRILGWNNWLLDDGECNIEKCIDVWDELYFEAQDLGFNGVAAASEMKFFFDNKMIEELEEYEKQVHEMLVGQMELKCAYDEKSILGTDEPLQLYARLLGTHTTLLTEESGIIKRKKT